MASPLGAPTKLVTAEGRCIAPTPNIRNNGALGVEAVDQVRWGRNCGMLYRGSAPRRESIGAETWPLRARADHGRRWLWRGAVPVLGAAVNEGGAHQASRQERVLRVPRHRWRDRHRRQTSVSGLHEVRRSRGGSPPRSCGWRYRRRPARRPSPPRLGSRPIPPAGRSAARPSRRGRAGRATLDAGPARRRRARLGPRGLGTARTLRSRSRLNVSRRDPPRRRAHARRG